MGQLITVLVVVGLAALLAGRWLRREASPDQRKGRCAGCAGCTGNCLVQFESNPTEAAGCPARGDRE